MSGQRLFCLGTRKLLHGFSKNASATVSKQFREQPFSRAMSSSSNTSRFDLNFQGDGTAVVTMKSGQNVLHPEMMEQFHVLLDQVEQNADCRALVTTGVDKFYCNGLDLDYVKTFTNMERQLPAYLDQLNRLIARLLIFPIPTVAAINGHAFAGGAVLALTHDLRVMRGDKGWICLNEVLVNVRFPPILMTLMRAKIPLGAFQSQAILFAKRFTANEALNSGLVDKVTDQSELVSCAQELANQMLGKHGIKRDILTLFKKDFYKDVLEAKQFH